MQALAKQRRTPPRLACQRRRRNPARHPACLLLATAHYQWRHHDGEAVRYLTMWHSTYLWLALLIATSLAKNGRTACKQHLILLLAAFTLYRLSA